MTAALPRVGLIGAGRLASALAPAIVNAGYPVVAVARGSAAARAAMADAGGSIATALSPTDSYRAAITQSLAGIRLADSAQAVADLAQLVFLTVPDGAIAQVTAAVHWPAGTAVVHCSGAAGLEVLRTAQEQGAEVGAFHPLQTFPGGEVDWRGVSVAIEAGTKLAAVLDRLAVALGARPLRLPAGARPLYHASAALASNYLVTLMAAASDLWPRFGFTREQGLAALLPLVHSTIGNVERLGAEGALTGPVARGDVGTVKAHLEAVGAQAPELSGLYRRLAAATVPIARRKGTLSEHAARELDIILQGDVRCA